MAKEWAQSFYASKQWRALRKQILRRDLYTCKMCEGRANEVHHIVELTEENISNYDIALNPNNLQSLCGNCHKKVTKGYTDDRGYYFDEQGMVIPIKKTEV